MAKTLETAIWKLEKKRKKYCGAESKYFFCAARRKI
jgi:hypothetical protein